MRSERRAAMAAIAALLALVGGCRRATSRSTPTDADAAPAQAQDVGATSLGPDAAALPSAGGQPSGAPPAEAPASRDVDAAAVQEARRIHAPRGVELPLLAPYAGELRAHFGAAAHGPLDVQVASLDGGRSALLVRRAGTANDEPLVLVVDAGRRVVWKKERPTGGIVPPVGDLAIASGPSGRVVLAACDPPTHLVALRQWNEDSTAFADFQVLDVEGCEALSLLRWPKHGWVVVVWRAGAARAALLGESGTLRWGDGIDVGAATRSGATGALAVDTADTFVLVERAALPGGQTAYGVEHLLAFRYDASGVSSWRAPVDLGSVPHAAAERLARPVVTSKREGAVEVTLGGRATELTSRGETRVAP